MDAEDLEGMVAVLVVEFDLVGVGIVLVGEGGTRNLFVFCFHILSTFFLLGILFILSVCADPIVIIKILLGGDTKLLSSSNLSLSHLQS